MLFTALGSILLDLDWIILIGKEANSYYLPKKIHNILLSYYT